MTHVFISYVRDDRDIVDKLCAELRAAGVTVWIDRDQITPGQRWQAAIRQAIQEGAYFLACFSDASLRRESTYMNEELTVAIEELRRHSFETNWFIPVLLTDVSPPARSIGAGETLRDLHGVSLHSDWRDGVDRILATVTRGRMTQPARTLTLQAIVVISLLLCIGGIVMYLTLTERNQDERDATGNTETASPQPANLLAGRMATGSATAYPDDKVMVLNPSEVKVDGDVGISLHRCTPTDLAIDCSVSLRGRNLKDIDNIVITKKSYAITDDGERLEAVGDNSRNLGAELPETRSHIRAMRTISFDNRHRPQWISVWLYVRRQSSGYGGFILFGTITIYRDGITGGPPNSAQELTRGRSAGPPAEPAKESS